MYTVKQYPSFAQWWNSIDRTLVFGFLILCFFGLILIASAGPAIAHRIGISDGLLTAQWWFFSKYIIFASISLAVMFFLSVLPPLYIRRIGVVLFILGLCLLSLTPLFGTEIKGAKRWILGIQPSEFVKPGLVIFCAWMMALAKNKNNFYGTLYSILALLITIGLLLIQPDFGQTILIVSVWTVMFFSTGANLLWFVGLLGLGTGGIMGGYYFLPHVRNRIDAFLSPDAFDKFGVNYQSDVARRAFNSGGLLGRGPGEGEIKQSLPDAHTDYIFAVAGEEFGLIACSLIIGLYGFMVVRTMIRVSCVHDHFSRFAVVGLMSLFGIQAFINMAVNVGLFPPKGMTLPFVSYGGSSVIALGFCAGFILCLSRKRPLGFEI